MSLIDDIKEQYEDEENQAAAAQAAAYYEKAEKCISDGNCDEILVQAGAEYVGVDPATAQLVYECAKDRDTDTCAKAGVTIGAIAACTYFSAGQSALCGKIAPFVVNLIWPVVGPVVTGTIDFIESFLGGISGGVQGVVDHIFKLLGKGGDKKDPVEFHREWAASFIVPTKKAIASAMLDGISAISAAEYSFVDMVNVHGSVGAIPKLNKHYNVESIRNKAVKNIRSSHLSLLKKHIKHSDKFLGDIHVLWDTGFSVNGPIQLKSPEYKIFRTKPSVKQNEVLLSMKVLQPKYDMTRDELEIMANTGDSVWNPVGYSIEKGAMVDATTTFSWEKRAEIMKQEYEAFTKALKWRLDGLIESTNGAVGEQISLKMANREADERSDGGSGWLLWTGLIGAGALAYVYRKKLFR